MKNIKSFKLFENSTISSSEVEELINDILVDLKDINDGFSWNVLVRKSDSGDFRWIHLMIVSKVDPLKEAGWSDVLDRLCRVLNSEDLRVYDKQDSLREVIPGNISPNWELPIAVENLKWYKEFSIQK